MVMHAELNLYGCMIRSAEAKSVIRAPKVSLLPVHWYKSSIQQGTASETVPLLMLSPFCANISLSSPLYYYANKSVYNIIMSHMCVCLDRHKDPLDLYRSNYIK